MLNHSHIIGMKFISLQAEFSHTLSKPFCEFFFILDDLQHNLIIYYRLGEHMFKDLLRTASLVQFLWYTNLLCTAIIRLLILYINLTSNVLFPFSFLHVIFYGQKWPAETAPVTFVKFCACFNSV